MAGTRLRLIPRQVAEFDGHLQTLENNRTGCGNTLKCSAAAFHMLAMFCVVLAGLLATLAAYVVVVRPTPAGPAAEAQAIGTVGRLHLSLSSVIKNHWKLVLKAGLIMSAAGVTLSQLTRDLPLMRSGIGEQARSAPDQRHLGPREGGHRRRPPGPLRHQRDQAVGSSSRLGW
ncbi:hypothetical protein HCN51_46055 [Nonomuraea sp. FMUSA5-5]|uniref:Uncharacterized protein n=1 Tax=Nonomuraea composti TaxID=2720023 RepID=A0ABX1BG49_9ACTN|nr:hypothetical protein [Nonomuraea sp. FMUSA5-5]NJP96715.1 hypothetical protein [Nonomuraea sp. FMUSA5-5]